MIDTLAKYFRNDVIPYLKCDNNVVSYGTTSFLIENGKLQIRTVPRDGSHHKLPDSFESDLYEAVGDLIHRIRLRIKLNAVGLYPE